MIEDKRFYRRGRIEIPITVNGNIRGKTINVSLGGTLCNVTNNIEIDSDVIVILNTQDDDVELSGVCISCNKFGRKNYAVTIKFNKSQMDPNSKKRRIISRYLERY